MTQIYWLFAEIGLTYEPYIRTLFKKWTDLRPKYKDFSENIGSVRPVYGLWARKCRSVRFIYDIFTRKYWSYDLKMPFWGEVGRKKIKIQLLTNKSKILKWSYLHVPWAKKTKSQKIQNLIKIPWGRRHGRRPLNKKLRLQRKHSQVKMLPSPSAHPWPSNLSWLSLWQVLQYEKVSQRGWKRAIWYKNVLCPGFPKFQSIFPLTVLALKGL